MTDRLRWIALAMLLAVALAPQAARADFPGQAVYLGAYGGAQVRLRGWDLGNSRNGYPEDRAAADVGIRLGFHVLSQLALELELGYLPVSQRDRTNHLLAYDLDILAHILKGNWSPVLEAGIGAYSNVSGNLGKDTDPRIHVGVGVRGLLKPWLAFRVDVRDVVSDGLDRVGANNLEATIGLDFFLSRPANAAPKPGDRDRDGIADGNDACPDQPGPAALKGCPDKDGDGIVDRDDRCPDQAGLSKYNGCPDKDGDGVIDLEDACPDQRGLSSLKGCPDRDLDGIPDKDDRCPEQAGPAKFKGCPDRDGDGLPDIDDRCPALTGLKEFDGCIPEKAAKFTGSIQGIHFATGSAKILPSSFPVLDGAAEVLAEFTSLRLRIEGHTDNVGKPGSNQKLSDERAAAVRAYLLKKGIAEDRLESVGYGETRPIADNSTVGGRAANRRIEFTVLGQR